MNSHDKQPEDAAELRRRAEARLQAQPQAPQSAVRNPQLEHELQVHQIELEMQNEELRRAQVELDRARARYFDLYDLAPVGYCILNEECLILEANLTAATLLGVTRGALVKRPLSQFILREDQDVYYRCHRLLFQTLAPQSCDLRMLNKDRPLFWVRIETSTAADAEGKRVSRLVLSDITESKRAEEEREKLQARLAQAREMETVGQLAGGLAHNFNNLHMGILNYVELGRDKLPVDHPVRGFLDEIASEAQRAADLTRQLLAFARKQTIAPKVLDLNATIVDAIKLLLPLLGPTINLTWTPGAGLWPVKLDPHQVDQILTGLCTNARDAIADVGKITVGTANAAVDEADCEDEADMAPGNYVVLTVSDTGRGMAKDALEKLFEPFFTTKAFGEEPGLGLSSVYGIVKQNDGFITVHSEQGKGTTFKICLPRFAGAEVPAAAAEAPTTPPRGTETVLLVEDEKSIRITTDLFLKDLGYTVLVAESPKEALLLAAAHPGQIDLLITDVIMPGMSGRDLANRLLELRPAIKCLFISGFTADVIAQRGILDDGVNFLSKPFGRDALARKVREMLGT